MRTRFFPLTIPLALFTLIACRQDEAPRKAKDQKTSEARDHSIELVGTLRKPKTLKMAHRLEIYPAGNLKVIEMLGDTLKDVPANAAVRVRGVVKSQVVGPAKDDPDPYPIQWGVWLRVAEVQVYPSVEEAFRELRERHLRGHDR